MADSDEPLDDEPAAASFEGDFVEPGPRRSTYTPPPPGNRYASAALNGDGEPSGEPSPPAQHTPATSSPWFPERKSLSDDELAAELQAELDTSASKPGAVLNAMEELERQLQLRVQEAHDYQDWEQSMLAIGTPDALEAVDQVRPQFEDVVASTMSIPIQKPNPSPPEQTPALDPFDFTTSPVVPEEPELAAPPALIEPPEPAPITGAVREVQVPMEQDVAEASLFEEPVLPAETPLPFSFDDLLVADPDEFASPVSAPVPLPVSVPVLVQDAVVETDPVLGNGVPIERDEQIVAADERPGGAVRLLWYWFAANASVVSVAVGALLFSFGMSLRQAVIATLVGLVLSAVPLAVGTVAGRRSAQPTLIVSRAAFGFYGNVLPALVALASRVFWGAALLWVLGLAVASILEGAKLGTGLGNDQIVILTMGIGFVVATVVAFFGLRVIAIFQLVVAIVSLVLVCGLIALTWKYVDFSASLTVPDGPFSALVAGAVLVFSVVGLAWAAGAADLAGERRPGASRGGAAVFAVIGTVLPAFVLIAYGALLAASDPAIAKGLVSDPVDTLSRMLPLWYPVPLIVAVGLSLLSAIVISIFSGASAFNGAGVRLHAGMGALIVAVLIFAVAWVMSVLGTAPSTLLRELAITLAVPVAAWVGIFTADVLIRRRPYDESSLVSVDGNYRHMRWANVIALVVITGIGWGLTSATLSGLDWQGYLFDVGGISSSSSGGGVVTSNIGVIVALVLGLLVSLGFGVRAVRRQEALEPTR